MKRCLNIVVVVSLLVTAVLGGPVEDYPQEMVSQDTTSDEQWETNYGYNAYQESFPQRAFEDMSITGQEPVDQQVPEEGFLMSEPMLPKKSAAELNHMLRLKHPKQEETSIIQSASCKEITHGSTIGLQYQANSARWLGCAGNPCIGAPCPGMFFTGAKWNNCWGEVFQIYRALGPGNIQSGDFVGLYYIRASQWFSLAGNGGHINPCPGEPSSTYGFNHLYNWFNCGGEVFQIYAFGKSNGAALTEGDAIVLYFPSGGVYVHFPVNGHAVVGNKCLAGRPPSSDTLDRCPENLIKVTVK